MIREAALADLAALTDLESTCFAGDAWSPALIESELLGETRSVLLTSDETGVIGYCSMRIVDGVADLQRIAVRPDARRQGLGRELLEELFDRATGLGATRMLLEVAASDEAAIGLYESFGFEPISRRHDYYADGTDAVVMERALGEWSGRWGSGAEASSPASHHPAEIGSTHRVRPVEVEIDENRRH